MKQTTSIVLNLAVYLVVILLVVLSFGYTSAYPLLIRVLIADLLGTVLIYFSSVRIIGACV